MLAAFVPRTLVYLALLPVQTRAAGMIGAAASRASLEPCAE